jgi:putative endonuclease
VSINIRKGMRFEKQARDYLCVRGLRLLRSNYRCRFGEIDLIMREGDTICFIEVRFRKSLGFGGASASITPAKQRKIVKTALLFLGSNRNLLNQALRFDVLLIQQQADGSLDFNWIKNAFYAE